MPQETGEGVMGDSTIIDSAGNAWTIDWANRAKALNGIPIGQGARMSEEELKRIETALDDSTMPSPEAPEWIPETYAYSMALKAEQVRALIAEVRRLRGG